MGLINGLALIILGGLCIPGLVAKKNPKAKDLLDKVAPYQGTIGLVLFAYGVWGIISAVLSLGMLGTWPLSWATALVGNLLNTAGGLILGFAMIQKFLLSRLPEDAQAKAGELREKLIGIQGNLGIWAIIAGLWTLVYQLVLRGILNI
ncbi:MAG: hypothetical protein PQJ60_01105 [Spirochaetales bacterium]|nr:hypothetical protein [Spirochaetales bacterium]